MPILFGHDAQGHDRLLTGVELDRQEAALRVHPQLALKSHRPRSWPFFRAADCSRLTTAVQDCYPTGRTRPHWSRSGCRNRHPITDIHVSASPRRQCPLSRLSIFKVVVS